ncbi:hypothetical protein CEK26_001126 [Fusarium fujikuroi]|nr:hypothetical protein CEK27_001126 [Fusarium fujikuroi]QGI89911.1 hypothetical protein CEK26_001126 [Fusarium fujikuroi]
MWNAATLKFPAWRCRGPDYEIRKLNAGNSDDELIGTNLNDELTNTPNNNYRCEASHGLPPQWIEWSQRSGHERSSKSWRLRWRFWPIQFVHSKLRGPLSSIRGDQLG